MSLTNFPAQIVLNQLPDKGISWLGDVPFSCFKRLFEESIDTKTDTTSAIYVRFDLVRQHFENDDHYFQLTLQANGYVHLECQRCLKPVKQPLNLDIEMALLAHEADVQWLPEDAEYLLFDDLQLIGNSLNHTSDVFHLLDFIEDELLLTIPISPRHTDCQMAVQQVGVIIETPKENPFAVLSDLKGKL